MGPDDALKAVKLIKPKKVVPIHYNTFDMINQDADAWANNVKKSTQAEPIVMKPGDHIEL
jgi:L-ascorbate metabolism protein UlaG (beta-lactamase superfamily)